MNAYQNQFIEERTKENKISAMQDFISFLIQNMGILLILLVGAFFAKQGMLSIGTLISFEMLATYLLIPIKNIVVFQSTFQKSLVSYNRANEILTQDKEPESKHHTGEIRKIGVLAISFNQVSIPLDKRKIIVDLTENIKSGERVALVGENGAGKSTLLRTIVKFYSDYQGEISIYGNSLTNISKKQMRNMVCYLPQQPVVFSGSLLENIAAEYKETSYNEKIDYLLKYFDIDKTMRVEENGENFSGGQVQRINLVRGLAREFDIMLLDESLSHLDKETVEKFFKLIQKKYSDKTFIIATHDELITANTNKVIKL